MSVLTVPWFEYELFVQFYNGSAHVSATYKNFSVRSNGGSYVISYDAFIDGAVGKIRYWYLLNSWGVGIFIYILFYFIFDFFIVVVLFCVVLFCFDFSCCCCCCLLLFCLNFLCVFTVL